MNDEIVGVRFLGRKFKPVAFGVTLMMLGLLLASVFRLGTYSMATSAGVALESLTAGASAALLLAGWVRGNVRFTEWGLLVGIFAYLSRFVYLLFLDLLGDSVMLALGVLIIIAGSYVLEVQDRGGQRWIR